MGFSRLLNMDRRGCGLSDPRNEALSLEDEARDVLAVLDAAGSERAVLMGYTTGGPLAITTAALAPERVQAIVLYASMARAVADDDVDWTYDEEERRRGVGAARAGVGHRAANLEQIAPVARRRPADEGVDGAHGAPVLEPGRARAADGLHRRPGHQRPARRAARPHADPAPHRRPPDRRAPLALPGRAHPRRALRRARGRRQPARRGRQLGHPGRDRGVPHRRALAHGGARAADGHLQRHRRLDRPRGAHGRRAAGATCSAPTRPRCAARSTASAGARSRRSATPS